MDKIVFNDYASLVYKMLETADSGDVAYAVCFFEDAVGVLKELMSIDDVSVGGIEIAEKEYNGYSKEYYISIDSDFIVDVQPAWHDTNEYNEAGYLYYEAAKTYIVGDANSAIIKNVDKSTCYEIEFDLLNDKSDFTDKFFDNASIVTDENGEPIGIGVDVMSLLLDLFLGE